MSYGPLILTGARALYRVVKWAQNEVESQNAELTADEEWAERGKALLDQNQIDDARKAFQRAIDINSRTVPGWIGKGLLAMRLDNGEELAFCANRIISIDHACTEGHTMLGVGWLLQEKHANALEAFGTARSLDRSSAVAPSLIGQSLLVLNRPSEALEAFEQSVRLKPDYINGQIGKANALNMLGREDQALPILEHYLKYVPLHIEVLQSLSISHAQLRQIEQAVNYIERAGDLISGSQPEAVKAREVSQCSTASPRLIEQSFCDIVDLLQLYGVLPGVFSKEEVLSVRIGHKLIRISLCAEATTNTQRRLSAEVSKVFDGEILFE